jgi:hypothetical protein
MLKFIKRKVDDIIVLEVEKRRNEIEKRILAEEVKLNEEYHKKISELRFANERAELEISELKKVREKAQTEQKQLWEKLDILRDNLNSEKVWLNLWECAVVKVTDMVWDIQKKETLKLLDIVRQEGFDKGIEANKKIYESKVDALIKASVGEVNIPLLMKRKEEAYSLYLTYQRKQAKDKEVGKENYYKGQVDLIGEILNEKK